MATGYAYDARLSNHDTGPGHPERPERLTAIISELESEPWFAEIIEVTATEARLESISRVHDAAYIARANDAISAGVPFLDSRDVAVSADSFALARLAAGAGLALGDAVIDGTLTNGFGIIRPPGHHAERDQALGFCIFNNIAILARDLQQRHGVERVAIVDWDVHHGNGTQHAFETDPSVLFISTHQFPYYPGTGAASEQGIGDGHGSVLNCPFPAGAGDDDYKDAFVNQIMPKLRGFRPDFLLVSAGFDAHHADPLGDIQLTTPFFATMTQWLMEIADELCSGRLISLLEGGYDLQALAACASLHLKTLASK